MAEENIDPELGKLLDEIDSAAKSTGSDVQDDNVEVDRPIDYDKEAQKSASLDLEPDENDIEDFNSIDGDDDDDDDDDLGETFEAEVIKEDKDREELERNVVGLLKQHCDSASAMFEEAETDRKKIDDIISILLPKIETEEYRGADIMALTSLIQTKADISRNRAANMDSIAKLFAALKNNDSIGIRGGGGDDDAPSPDEVARLLGGKKR